jgi:hypothetical protein
VPDYAKNHVVPVALLRGFTDPSGRLYVFMPKTGRVLRNQLPESVAHHSKFYWVDGGNDPAVLEKGLASEVDGPAATVFARLRERPRLPNATELGHLALFIAFQMVRVPGFREWQRELLRTSIPSELADELTPQEFESAKSSFGDPGVSLNEYQRLLKTGKIDLQLNKNEQLRSMAQQAAAIVPWLLKRNWSVRIVPVGAPPLVLSDVPVKSITRHEDSFTVTPGRLGWPNTEIALAISKEILLHGRITAPTVSFLTPDAVRDFNFATAWGATRVFSSEPTIEGLDPRAPTNARTSAR